MPKSRAERIRTYILIGVSLVFVATGYFRFVYKKAANNVVATQPSIPATPPVIPQVQMNKLLTLQKDKSSLQEPMRANLRNIFLPLKFPVVEEIPLKENESSKVENQPAAAEPPVTEMPLKLGGVIVGGGKPIAIINGQMVREGDWIGEFRVIKIGKKDVLLRSGNDQRVLEVFGSK